MKVMFVDIAITGHHLPYLTPLVSCKEYEAILVIPQNVETLNCKQYTVKSKKEYEDEIISSVTIPLNKVDSSNTNLYKVFNIKNITKNDNGDFLVDIPSGNPNSPGIEVAIPRELIKKVIYDIYLS
jgi:hypothetical protein